MKTFLWCCLAAAAWGTKVSGGDYQASFDKFPGPEIAGTEGWLINDATPNLSFLPIWNGSLAAALGGFFDAPKVAKVALTHPYGEALGNTRISFGFTLNDSSDQFPKRDVFGVSFATGAIPLFTVFFTPDTQVAKPSAPPDALWKLAYASGMDTPTSLSVGVLEGGTYRFLLAFSPNGGATDFHLTITGRNPINLAGTIAVAPTTVATDFGLIWLPGSPDPGDNFLIVDDLGLALHPPVLALERIGGSSVLSWSGAAKGYRLEFTTDVAAAAWTPVTNSPTLIAGRFSVTHESSDDRKFYRLRP